MTNVEGMTKSECRTGSRPAAGFAFVIGISDFFRHSEFVILNSSFVIRRQRLEQDGADHAEDGGVGPDPKGEREGAPVANY
jgi:hypothetical protein